VVYIVVSNFAIEDNVDVARAFQFNFNGAHFEHNNHLIVSSFRFFTIISNIEVVHIVYTIEDFSIGT